MAAAHDKVIRDTILLCEKVGINQINTFQVVPATTRTQNIPTGLLVRSRNEYSEILEWQWNENLFPYWTDMAKFAKEHGVDKLH